MITSESKIEQATWDGLRQGDSVDLRAVISRTAPAGMNIASITHLRTAHYAVYRVSDTLQNDWIVRLGVSSPEDSLAVDNSGFLGTSKRSPTGQMREYIIASDLAAAHADVCVPEHYSRTPDGFEALWLPYIDGIPSPLRAAQWYTALTGLYSCRPEEVLPVFTNRAKTFARLDDMEGDSADKLRETYDEQLKELFATATQWSVVHGDAHGGNAINTGDRAVLFDFDTACWGPSVWDLTHLLNRAGTGIDSGYAAEVLRSMFPFTGQEVMAALSLRRTAASIAKLHRENTLSASRVNSLQSMCQN